jgi:hypothetical protein
VAHFQGKEILNLTLNLYLNRAFIPHIADYEQNTIFSSLLPQAEYGER